MWGPRFGYPTSLRPPQTGRPSESGVKFLVVSRPANVWRMCSTKVACKLVVHLGPGGVARALEQGCCGVGRDTRRGNHRVVRCQLRCNSTFMFLFRPISKLISFEAANNLNVSLFLRLKSEMEWDEIIFTVQGLDDCLLKPLCKINPNGILWRGCAKNDNFLHLELYNGERF